MTGVQTCALPICEGGREMGREGEGERGKEGGSRGEREREMGNTGREGGDRGDSPPE